MEAKKQSPGNFHLLVNVFSTVSTTLESAGDFSTVLIPIMNIESAISRDDVEMLYTVAKRTGCWSPLDAGERFQLMDSYHSFFELSPPAICALA